MSFAASAEDEPAVLVEVHVLGREDRRAKSDGTSGRCIGRMFSPVSAPALASSSGAARRSGPRRLLGGAG
jgi:hypothetical protein